MNLQKTYMDTLIYISELENALALANAKLDVAHEQLAMKSFQLKLAKLALQNLTLNGNGRN